MVDLHFEEGFDRVTLARRRSELVMHRARD
jgi:hypothetical protein